jgi:glucose/arabinose dehydrogenase
MEDGDPARSGDERRLGRRAAMRVGLAGLGGLATVGLLPVAGPPASAAIIPDPIPRRIERSGLTVELAEFSTPPRTSATAPHAMLNFLYHAGDGSSRVFANDSWGKIWLINRSTGGVSLFLDLAKARGQAFLPKPSQMGLRSFAFHPDFARAGTRGYRKLYTVSTETAASRPSGVPLFSGPFPVKHHDVVAEWSVDPDNLSRVKSGSRREVLRIAQYKADHNTDQLMFDPNAKRGEPGYGKMFVGVGDGGNVPASPDPYDQAQDPGRALGKILRIDPLKQADGRRYAVPADNPFRGRSGYLPEIWALGLRHPQNLSFDRGGTGAFLVTDIGQAHIEEVNLGLKGANYGWPLREGTFVTDRTDSATLYGLPPGDEGNGFTYPVAQYDHDEGTAARKAAIAGGFVYRGTAVPALVGHYLLGDIVNGRVFHVPVSDLRPGSQAVVKELALIKGGQPTTLMALIGGANGRVNLRFGQDELGEVYILTKQDGKIRRLAAA